MVIDEWRLKGKDAGPSFQSSLINHHASAVIGATRRSPPLKPTAISVQTSVSGIGSGRGSVKFNLIDKVESLADEKIVAVKYVTLAEEYLADHFPTFPVLPGVLMLEAITQAAGWLLHHRTRFAKSMAILKEAKNVKYGSFVAPGSFLRVEVEFMKQTEAGASFKASGTVNAAAALSARVELAYFNLADKQPELANLDARLTEHNRARWNVLHHGRVRV
jgi:3-hydroxyacyl-[acyl-carrier-protein] dehydratase